MNITGFQIWDKTSIDKTRPSSICIAKNIFQSDHLAVTKSHWLCFDSNSSPKRPKVKELVVYVFFTDRFVCSVWLFVLL